MSLYSAELRSEMSIQRRFNRRRSYALSLHPQDPDYPDDDEVCEAEAEEPENDDE